MWVSGGGLEPNVKISHQSWRATSHQNSPRNSRNEDEDAHKIIYFASVSFPGQFERRLGTKREFFHHA